MSERARWTARLIALAWMGACAPRAMAPLAIQNETRVPVRPGTGVEEAPPPQVPISTAPVDMSAAGWEVRIHSRWLRTPAVAEGRVYVGGGLGSRDMIAYDARTGAEVWRTRVGDVGPTSALVHQGRVIFGTESCHVHSLDAETGAIEWERYLGDPITAAPAAGSRRVIAAHRDERRDGWALTALTLRTGEPEWSVALSDNVLDAPVLAGDSVFLSTAAGEVCAFVLTSGEPRWCRPLGAIGAPTVYGHEVRVVVWPRGAGGQRLQLTATLEGLEPGRAEVFAFVQEHLSELGECGWNRPLRLPVTVEREGSVIVDTSSVDGLPPVEGREPEPGSPRACLDAVFARLRVAPIGARVVHDLRMDRGGIEIARLDVNGRVLGSFGREPLGGVPQMAARGGGLWLWHYEGPRVLVSAEDSVEVLGGTVRVRERRSVMGDDTLRWSHFESGGLTVPAVAGRAFVFGTAAGALVVHDRASGRVLSRSALPAGVASQPVLWDGWVYLVTVDGRLIARDLRHVLEPDARYPMWGGGATREGRVL